MRSILAALGITLALLTTDGDESPDLTHSVAIPATELTLEDQ